MTPQPPATIFAPATALGRAAIGIVRVSGPDVAMVCAKLTGHAPPEPRKAVLGRLLDEDGHLVDRPLLLFFPSPTSFTGEDMLEIHHHGGVGVARFLLERLADMDGCRPAEPGELSKRAFLNGKLDLTQAEGLADLIEASTLAQLRQAAAQLEGGLRDEIEGWRTRLVDALALIEAEIDFAPDQPVPAGLWSAVESALRAVRAEVGRKLAEGHGGERLRQGITIAVTGPPNVGKSSLVNLLARRDVAIVTPLPGTTRDVLEVPLDLGGLAALVLDTAGLRETEDPIEAEGIRRARRSALNADIELMLTVDPAEPLGSPDGRRLVVRNKCDSIDASDGCMISCTTGRGIEALIDRLKEMAGALVGSTSSAPLTRLRHRQALTEVVEHLDACMAGDPDGALDRLCEDLRLAVRAMGRLSGHVDVEQLLDRIFSEFCIGK